MMIPEPWTLDDLCKRVGAPVEEVIPALFRLVREDPRLDRSAIINPGCMPAELDAAERRIAHALHPLHRLLLTLSNGGSLPCVGELSLLAAAVARETEWRIVGPFLTAEEQANTPVIVDRLLHPVEPWVLGDLPRDFDPEDIGSSLQNIVLFALGYGDLDWGYALADPARIDCYHEIEGGGCWQEASDFEAFLLQRPLYLRLCTIEFAERVRAARA